MGSCAYQVSPEVFVYYPSAASNARKYLETLFKGRDDAGEVVVSEWDLEIVNAPKNLVEHLAVATAEYTVGVDFGTLGLVRGALNRLAEADVNDEVNVWIGSSNSTVLKGRDLETGLSGLFTLVWMNGDYVSDYFTDFPIWEYKNIVDTLPLEHYGEYYYGHFHRLKEAGYGRNLSWGTFLRRAKEDWDFVTARALISGANRDKVTDWYSYGQCFNPSRVDVFVRNVKTFMRYQAPGLPASWYKELGAQVTRTEYNEWCSTYYEV